MKFRDLPPERFFKKNLTDIREIDIDPAIIYN